MAISDVTIKTCARCKNTYPATSEYFWSDKHTHDGLFSRCRSCGKSKVKREKLPDGMKRCSRCKNILPNTAEYFAVERREPLELRVQCVDCYRTAQIQWREEHQGEYLDYHATYRHEHAEAVSTAKRRWFQEHKAQVRPRAKVAKRRYELAHPDRYRAHVAVMSAIQRGKLLSAKAFTCAKCGKQAEHYHHPSYEQQHRLDVIPLCSVCHTKEHHP